MRARDRRDEPPVAARESRARGWRRAIVIAVLAGIALVAAACGGGSSGPVSVAATSPAASRQPYLAYARCLRAHGAPFWPETSTYSKGGGGYEYPVTARILAQEHGPSWNAALSACAKLAPPQLPFTETQLEAADSRLLKAAGCLRAHGFPGLRAAAISPYNIGVLPPRGANPGNPSPKFQAAEQACHWPPAR